jgi:hypothetical protein
MNPTQPASEIENGQQIDTQTPAAENERLRERISELEAELVEVQARTNAAVAEWQERAYWLDRWHLDLNALMRRRGASEFRAALRGVRSVARAFKRLKRGLRRS